MAVFSHSQHFRYKVNDLVMLKYNKMIKTELGGGRSTYQIRQEIMESRKKNKGKDSK